MHNDFFSTVGEILKYGGSTFAALVVGCIYTTTDGFFIGNWVGTDGLEAMALVFPVTILFGAIGTLFETGGSAVVAKEIGEGKKSLAEKIMRTNYICAAVIGIVVAVVGNLTIEPSLHMLADAPGEYHVADMAISFLRITFCGVPFLLTTYLTSAFMRCIGNPTHVFYFVGSSAVLNVVLDALFIVVFGWGMEGAALATVIAQAFSAVMSVWYFRYSRQRFSSALSFGGLEYIVMECKVGAGFAMATLMMCAIEYFLNATLLEHDAPHLLAVATVSNIVLTIVFLPLNGLDTGIQPLVSKLFAAKKIEHCLRVMRYNFFLTMVLNFTMYAALMFCAEEVVRVFVANNEPITPEMILFVRLMFLLQPFVGFYTWLSGIMAALEDEWRNVVISLLPLVVQMPLIWLLPKILPIEYVAFSYSALDVAEATVAFLLIHSFLRSKGLSLKKIFA